MKNYLKVIYLTVFILLLNTCSSLFLGPSGEAGETSVTKNIPFNFKVNGQTNSFFTNSSKSLLSITWEAPLPLEVNYYELDYNSNGVSDVSFIYSSNYYKNFANGIYDIRVRLIDQKGYVSPWSKPIHVLLEDNIPNPNLVSGFTVTPIAGTLTASVKWNPATDAESGLNNYVLAVGSDAAHFSVIIIYTDENGNLKTDNFAVLDPSTGTIDFFADNTPGWIQFIQTSAGTPPFEVIVKCSSSGTFGFNLLATDRSGNKTNDQSLSVDVY